MPQSNLYLYRYEGNIIYCPHAFPPEFRPDETRTWPHGAFALPMNLAQDELLDALRQHLPRPIFKEYCTTALAPESLTPELRERLELDTFAALETPANAPDGSEQAQAEQAQARAQLELDARNATARTKAAVERERAKLGALQKEIPLKDFELPPPEPPALPASLANLRAAVLARGPQPDSVAVPGSLESTARTFEVDHNFTDFTGKELNFLVWAEQMGPRDAGNSGSWIPHLLQLDRGNEGANLSGAELERRHRKLIRWLYDFYIVQLPAWLAAVEAGRANRSDSNAPVPEFQLPDVGGDFSPCWEPAWKAATLLRCTESQLSRICKLITGLNARELWDLVRIRHAGVKEMFEYEMRLLRYDGFLLDRRTHAEADLEGVSRSLKRARRYTGRLRSTLARRLGFLNNARLDRGFMQATGKTLSELEAELCLLFSEEGTLEQQLERWHEELARKLASTDLPQVSGDQPHRLSFSKRVRRTPCRNLKNLVQSAFAAATRRAWYKRRVDKLQKMLESPHELSPESDSKPEPAQFSDSELMYREEREFRDRIAADDSIKSGSLETNSVSVASERPETEAETVPPEATSESVQYATAAEFIQSGSPPKFVQPASAMERIQPDSPEKVPVAARPSYTAEEIARLRWRCEEEFRFAARAWTGLQDELVKALAPREPGPLKGYLPPPGPPKHRPARPKSKTPARRRKRGLKRKHGPKRKHAA